MKRGTLPRTARDALALRRKDALLFGAVVSFADLTGIWRHPIRSRGDLERMRFLDKAYWIYKAGRPTKCALRGSGIEEYFATRKDDRAVLPEGFRTDAEISISAVGDLMSHPFLARSGDRLYADVEDLVFGADIATANLECVVSPADERELVISADTAPSLYYDDASFAVATTSPRGRRFALLSAASNHTLDFGGDGVDGTIRVIEREGMAYAGVTPREGDPFTPTIIARNGVRVGVVAYTFGFNGKPAPRDRPWIVHRLALNDRVVDNDFSQLERQIARAREERIDFLVAQLHWGFEHEFYPMPDQIELAHHLAELGVDAIIGHHSHILQPMELYRPKRAPERVVPIFYSLGNLITPFALPESCRSGVARITLAKGARAGRPGNETHVRNADIVPVVQVVDEHTRQIRLRRD